MISSRVFIYVLFCLGLALTDRVYIDRTLPHTVPEGWTKVSKSHPEAEVQLTFALKQRNIDVFSRIFEEVTDPQSSRYGKYLSLDAITNILAPSFDDVQAVQNWLSEHGVSKVRLTRNKDMVETKMSVQVAEKLLNTTYHTYYHDETDAHHVRSVGPYTAPNHVAAKLDFVTGHIGFDGIKANLHVSDAPEAISIMPANLRERYNVSKSATGTSTHNRQGTAQFLGNFFDPRDNNIFFNTYWPEHNFNSTVSQIIGENRPEAPSEHASLDIQYLMGLAPNIPTWVYSNTGFDFWSDLTGWLNMLNSRDDIPYVHSMTYGNQGAGPSGEYRERFNTELMKLGSRGITILVSAGDQGTGCYACWYYEPGFPATSPYVTTIGATKFVEDKPGPECAPLSFATGGGFSWYNEQPAYQTRVVTHYFANSPYLPEAHFFNRNGRGIPDLSALGVGYQIFKSGSLHVVDGTAAATTTVAAIISLLNEIRIVHRLPTLGFMNPWLYQIADVYSDAFFDVVKGNNHYGCCGWAGFFAAPGWDPVTGLGTPNYNRLQNIVRTYGLNAYK